MNRKTFLILAVAFPILMMAGWVAKVFYERTYSEEIELKITGYDPRDILSGHYLVYRVDYGKNDLCSDHYKGFSRELCVCVDGRPAQAVSAQACPETSCRRYIRGKCSYSGFEAGIERFYFSETFENKLAQVPPQATIRVSLTKNGTAHVKDVYVDKVPLSEWLKK